MGSIPGHRRIAAGRPGTPMHSRAVPGLRLTRRLLLPVGAAAIVARMTAVGAQGPPPSSALKALHEPREKHLANVRQLTFGGQNAEAYWSPDGKKIIFQSTRDSLDADQIFTMNADGSDVKMVSTGKGRTTCAYFLRNGREIIYSSTHDYSPNRPPEPDRSQGYVWPIYPYYNIYRANADGTRLRPIMPRNVKRGHETAYNAESTVSPDGRRIIFTSTFDGDLDLYTMNTDGRAIRRITNTLGYDGGAFFSHSGKKIVWRANHPKTEEEKEEYLRLLKQHLVRPTRMEIWTANADGTEPRQVTSLGAASFAPYFTPDDQKIIFASNFEDPAKRQFELYLINVDGTGIERVTYGGEFDSFPMFSPDGRKLLWASNRNGKVPRETNIFVADWIP